MKVALLRVRNQAIAILSPQQHIDEINNLVTQYSKIEKSTPATKKITSLPLSKSRIQPMNIPTKAIKLRRAPPPTLSRLNKQLSTVRHLHRNTGANFKKSAVLQLVAQHVFAHPQMNHVFNEITGRRELSPHF